MGKKHSWWYLDLINFLLIILILFFGGAVISSQIILNDELVYVPNITGKTVDEAGVSCRKEIWAWPLPAISFLIRLVKAELSARIQRPVPV
jgi:hypothetical protein